MKNNNPITPMCLQIVNNILWLLLALLPGARIYGQAPESIAYQAVLRDASGTARTDAAVNLTLSIHQGSETGSVVFSEVHHATTNGMGQVWLEVGSENPLDFVTIDWADGPYYIQIETEGNDLGSSQLLSVPYALYAKSSKSRNLIEAMGMIHKNTSGTIKDIEGNIYETVTIGTQTWMAENLRTGTLNDGTPINLVTEFVTWSGTTDPAYCWYGYATANAYSSVVLGALYNWYTVNTGHLCPAEWHVPNDAEWTILTNYLGGLDEAGGKLKETGTKHWTSPNTGATNESGFTALPGGMVSSDGLFYQIGLGGIFWSSGENSATDAWIRTVANTVNTVSHNLYIKKGGCSVRCVRD